MHDCLAQIAARSSWDECKSADLSDGPMGLTAVCRSRGASSHMGEERFRFRSGRLQQLVNTEAQ